MAQQSDILGDNVEVSPPIYDSSTQCNSKVKTLTSSVWDDMTRHVSDKGTTASCHHCKKKFNANPNHGTSHLKRHVESCSVRRYRDIKGYCISGGGSSNKGDGTEGLNQVSLRKSLPNLDEIRESFSVFVVAGGNSFSIVEEDGFKNMMRVIAPDFHLISRHTLKRDAISQYNEEKKRVCIDLQNAPGRISFTTDNWRSENTAEEFMCVTAHWVDTNWKLQKRIIKFSALTPPFDGAALADEILMCLGEWKVFGKVFTFTLDNASYNDTMIASIKSHLLRKHSLVIRGEFFHMRCCCHIINLVVHAGLKLIDEVVLKIRQVVVHLRRSIPKTKRFYEMAVANFGLSNVKRLRLDVLTRWNSTFTMLDRFLYFQDAIDSFVSRDLDLRMHRLTSEEWEKVAKIHSFLKIFFDITNDFSASSTPTANVYFNGVWSIHMQLNIIAEGPHCILSGMVAQMQAKFAKYWSEYNILLSCAAVLDPRLKLEAVSFCYTKLFGETIAEEMTKKVKNKLYELADEYKGGVINLDSEENGETEHLCSNYKSKSADAGVRKFNYAHHSELFDHLNKKMKTSSKSELENYFDDERVSATENIDILEFWKANSRRYPTLSLVARDILAIPISSVPSESAFSLGKKMITYSRSSLASSTIEALVCYEDWLRVKGLRKGASKILKIGDNTEDVEDDDDE